MHLETLHIVLSKARLLPLSKKSKGIECPEEELQCLGKLIQTKGQPHM